MLGGEVLSCSTLVVSFSKMRGALLQLWLPFGLLVFNVLACQTWTLMPAEAFVVTLAGSIWEKDH